MASLRFFSVLLPCTIVAVLTISLSNIIKASDEDSDNNALSDRDKTILDCLIDQKSSESCTRGPFPTPTQSDEITLFNNPSAFAWPKLKGDKPAELFLQKDGLIFGQP